MSRTYVVRVMPRGSGYGEPHRTWGQYLSPHKPCPSVHSYYCDARMKPGVTQASQCPYSKFRTDLPRYPTGCPLWRSMPLRDQLAATCAGRCSCVIAVDRTPSCLRTHASLSLSRAAIEAGDAVRAGWGQADSTCAIVVGAFVGTAVR